MKRQKHVDVDVDVHVHVHIHTIYVSRATQCAYKINIVSNCSPAGSQKRASRRFQGPRLLIGPLTGSATDTDGTLTLK